MYIFETFKNHFKVRYGTFSKQILVCFSGTLELSPASTLVYLHSISLIDESSLRQQSLFTLNMNNPVHVKQAFI